jgi:hypothetical protein
MTFQDLIPGDHFIFKGEDNADILQVEGKFDDQSGFAFNTNTRESIDVISIAPVIKLNGRW